jgi:RNA polymerase sigma-70 factor, ECF subfamily
VISGGRASETNHPAGRQETVESDAIALVLRRIYTDASVGPTEEGVELFSFDDAYLRRLREGDFQTEQHFVAYFGKLLLIKARSRIRSSEAADDIRQETFVRVLKTIRTEGGIRNPAGLGAFVNSVCNNVLQEFYRSSSRTDYLDEESREIQDSAIDLDGMLASRQVRERVRDILDRLPERDRRLLRAMFLEEKEKDEICQEFGVDRDYLRVLLHRAKQSFRAIYQENVGLKRAKVEN